MADQNQKVMTLRLPARTAEELEAVAQVDGQRVSEAVRDAIDERIRQRRADKDFQERRRRMLEENKRALELLAD